MEVSPGAELINRTRDMVAYEDGFLAVDELAVAFWSPRLGGFCPVLELPIPGLDTAVVLGDDVLIAPNSDADSLVIRVVLLRREP